MRYKTMLEEYPTGSQIVQSLKARTDLRRSFIEKATDLITSIFSSVTFLIFNLVWFLLWIAVNLNLIPGVPVFDPFPFGLLTMMVSLEAIVLSIFVLISQNRVAAVDELREEIDLQVNLITEQELTKLMHIAVLIAKKNGIDLSKDGELEKMLDPLPKERIEKTLQKEISPNL